MSDSKKGLRGSPSLIISILALVIAMSAGAYAAVIAPKNSVLSSSIKNQNVKSADIKNGAVTKKKLGAATKADLNDAASLGGLSLVEVIAASGGEYYESKQVGSAALGTSGTEMATLNLPHAGKYLVNVRVPVECRWDETGGADPDVDVADLDQPNFPVFASLVVAGTAVESQSESCEVENRIDGGVLIFIPDVWRGTATVEFTRLVEATGPTTVSVTASQNTSFGLFGSPIENKFKSVASASETHIQAVTVQ